MAATPRRRNSRRDKRSLLNSTPRIAGGSEVDIQALKKGYVAVEMFGDTQKGVFVDGQRFELTNMGED